MLNYREFNHIAEPMHVDALIVEEQLLEIDAIREIGRMYITRLGRVHFLEGDVPQCAAVFIDKPNYSTKFYLHKV